MKAVFVHQDVLMRDSHIDPGSTDAWHLVPATVEAMRMLADEDTLVLIYGSRDGAAETTSVEEEPDRIVGELVRQIQAGGGRVDGLIACPHGEERACLCWADFAAVFWLPASQFSLNLRECFVLADSERDVATARAAGMPSGKPRAWRCLNRSRPGARRRARSISAGGRAR